MQQFFHRRYRAPPPGFSGKRKLNPRNCTGRVFCTSFPTIAGIVIHTNDPLYKKAFQGYLRNGTPVELYLKQSQPTIFGAPGATLKTRIGAVAIRNKAQELIGQVFKCCEG